MTRSAPLHYNRSTAAIELIKFGSVYFFLALINIKAKLVITTAWFNGTLEHNHSLLMKFVYTGDEQSRLLQYFIPQFIYYITDIPITKAYILQRLVFMTLSGICFHYYLKKWFDIKTTFCGVVFFAAILPLTYMNKLQESAPLLALTFLLGLWAIRDKKDLLFCIILLIGVMNNETMLFLPVIYLFYNIRSIRLWNVVTTLLRTIIIALPAYGAEAYIRYLTRNNTHLGSPWHLNENISGIVNNLSSSPLDYWAAAYLYVFIIFGMFWIYAFRKFKDKNLFIQRSMLTVPLFVLPHFITGNIYEVRQMIPLGFIIIPSALSYLFKIKNHQSQTE